MVYILIIFASVNYYSGGLALTHVEFSSKQDCLVARGMVLSDFKIDTNYGKVHALCVEK